MKRNKKKQPQVRNIPVANPETTMIMCSMSLNNAIGSIGPDESLESSPVWFDAFIASLQSDHMSFYIVQCILYIHKQCRKPTRTRIQTHDNFFYVFISLYPPFPFRASPRNCFSANRTCSDFHRANFTNKMSASQQEMRFLSRVPIADAAHQRIFVFALPAVFHAF